MLIFSELFYKVKKQTYPLYQKGKAIPVMGWGGQ
jgi:hypothetical protein